MAGKDNAGQFYRTAIASGLAYERWGRYYDDLPFPCDFYSPEEYMFVADAIAAYIAQHPTDDNGPYSAHPNNPQFA